MELSAVQRDRLAEIATEARKTVGGYLRSDGRPMTFAELDDGCIEAGELMTSDRGNANSAVGETGASEAMRSRVSPQPYCNPLHVCSVTNQHASQQTAG